MKKMRTKPLFGRGKLQKMLLVTRIGLLCILAFNITAAANVFSQAFNLKMKNVTLEEVLLEIQKKSSFDIICNSEQISNIKNLSVKVENANVEEILKQCLKGTVLSYEIVDNTVVIYEQKRLEAAPQQTKIVIKGLILEADGRPLPGAAVYLKGNKVIGFDRKRNSGRIVCGIKNEGNAFEKRTLSHHHGGGGHPIERCGGNRLSDSFQGACYRFVCRFNE